MLFDYKDLLLLLLLLLLLFCRRLFSLFLFFFVVFFFSISRCVIRFTELVIVCLFCLVFGRLTMNDILAVIFGNRFYRSTFFRLDIDIVQCRKTFTSWYMHTVSFTSIHIDSVCCIWNEFFFLSTGHTCSYLLRALLWKLHINMMSNALANWHNDNKEKKGQKLRYSNNHYTDAGLTIKFRHFHYSKSE